MNRRILFALIPKPFWIAWMVAITFVIIGGEYIELAFIILNVTLFFLAGKVAVLFHEIGHLLLAKMVGGTPRRMVLGRGHKVLQTEVSGIKVVLHSQFNSGLAYAAFDDLSAIRSKLFIYTCGGFLMNFLLAAGLLSLFDFSPHISEGIHLASCFILANIVTGVTAMIPFYTTYQGLRLATDGLSIFKIPFYKKSDLLVLSHVNELLDAYDLTEAKKYKEAIDIYEGYESKTGNTLTTNINRSSAYVKMGEFQKARELLEELLPVIDEKDFKAFKNIIYNGLAWDYLLANRLDEADKCSELAYKADPNSEYIRGTRASVLIEIGAFEAGKNMLLQDVDFNFPNNQTLTAAMYLSLAFHQLRKPKLTKKYQKFVDDNLEKLDVDERVLYDRILTKIHTKV